MMQKGDIVYYARIIPQHDIYEILELTIRTVEEHYFVGVDQKTKQAHMFSEHALNEIIFNDRNEALDKVKFEEDKLDIHRN